MKNLKIAFILLIISNITYSQSLDDALRYSKSNLSGTARYVSMGGAFGALGGDLSSISDNPAATGVFMYSEINFSPALYNSVNKTEFSNNISYDNRYNFNFNNFAFVASLKTKDNDWKSINYAFTYKRLDNYHHNYYAYGVNNDNSITDFFAEQANGTSLYDLDNNYDGNYIGDNAYQTYLIDPDSVAPSNTGYHSMYNNYGETQSNTMKTKGRKDQWSFAIGSNYKDILYIGASLDYSTINFKYSSNFRERDLAKNIDNFKEMQYYNEYNTTGYGYAFKIGFIVKPVKWLRMAYSFQTPIRYYLSDSYSHVIDSWGISANGEQKYRSSASPIGNYDYYITTPLKMNAALGFVIAKKAVIGLEYNYLDYSRAQIRSIYNSDEFASDNAAISRTLKPSHNAKIGFEYRLGQVSLRTGISYFDSPYTSSQMNKNAYTIYYNGGIGFNIDFYYIDFAYSYGQSNFYYYPYQLESTNTTAYYISQNTNKIIMTMGVRF